MALPGTISPSEVSVLHAIEQEGVRVVDAPSVAAYLACHPEVAALTADICRRTLREFGPSSSLSLELYRDPETPDRFLTLFVRQTAYTSDILRRTSAIMEEFSARFAEGSGWIQVTTDFQPPQ